MDEVKESKKLFMENKEELKGALSLTDEMYEDEYEHHDGTGSSLPPTTQVIINETDEMVSESIAALRELITQHDDKLCYATSDELLLRMLRARKFNVERAYQLLHAHMDVRVNQNLEPAVLIRRKGVQEVLRSGFMILPEGIRDRRGRQLMIFNINKYDIVDKVTDDDVVHAMWLTLEIALKNPQTQRLGVAMVTDLGELSLPFGVVMRYEMRLGPRMMKLMVSKQAARFGDVFLLRSPWYVRALVNIVSVFLSKKLKDRFHLFKEEKLLEEMSKYFTLEAIEKKFGGKLEYDREKWADEVIEMLMAEPVNGDVGTNVNA